MDLGGGASRDAAGWARAAAIDVSVVGRAETTDEQLVALARSIEAGLAGGAARASGAPGVPRREMLS